MSFYSYMFEKVALAIVLATAAFLLYTQIVVPVRDAAVARITKVLEVTAPLQK
jgi:hypothetical protein